MTISRIKRVQSLFCMGMRGIVIIGAVSTINLMARVLHGEVDILAQALWMVELPLLLTVWVWLIFEIVEDERWGWRGWLYRKITPFDNNVSRQLMMNMKELNNAESYESSMGKGVRIVYFRIKLITMTLFWTLGAFIALLGIVEIFVDEVPWNLAQTVDSYVRGVLIVLDQSHRVVVALMLFLWLLLWLRIAWLNEQLKRRFKEVLAALEKLGGRDE